MTRKKVTVEYFPVDINAYIGECIEGEHKLKIKRVRDMGKEYLSAFRKWSDEEVIEDVNVCVPEGVDFWEVETNETLRRRYHHKVVARDQDEAISMMRSGDSEIMWEKDLEGEIVDEEAWKMGD